MKTYDVFFEVFNKKLKTQILAESESDVKNIVRNKIIFHKITEVVDEDNYNGGDDEVFNNLLNIFNLKLPKK